MMVRTWIGLAVLLSVLSACGGGGGGGSSSDELHLGGSALALPFWSGAVESVQGRVLLMVNEAAQASLDLNNDGDFGDNVAFLFDPATGARTNLGRSIDFQPVAADRFVGWRLSEFSEGQTDFSGDSILDDSVLAVFDTEAPVGPLNPRVTNLVIPTGGTVRAAGDRFILALFEMESGDLNGDLDQNDTVLVSYDPVTNVVQSSNRAWGGGIAIDGYQVALTVNEDADGMIDYNTDGDPNDNVPFLFRADNGMVTPIFGGLPTLRAVTPVLAIAGNRLAAFLDEAADGGQSYNGAFGGDNDDMDFVLIIYNLGAGTSVLPSGGLASDPASLVMNANYLAVTCLEADSGLGSPIIDFNSDGDDADSVVHWVDLASPALARNVGVAASISNPLLRVCDSYLVFQASESDQGPGVNYNVSLGDIDTSDTITAFLALDVPGSPLRFTGIDSEDLVCFAGENCFFISAPEADNGSFDFNEDGDTNDVVPIYFRVVGGLPVRGEGAIPTDGPVAFQITPSWIRIFGNASEMNGFGDLNEDGDLLDFAIVSTRISRESGEVESFNRVFTCDTDGSSFPIVVDADTVIFPYAESMFGTGLNGNGVFGDVDANDLLLYYVNTGNP